MDEDLVECRNRIISGILMEDVTLGTDGGLRYKGKLIVPHSNSELKQTILLKALNYKFTIVRTRVFRHQSSWAAIPPVFSFGNRGIYFENNQSRQFVLLNKQKFV